MHGAVRPPSPGSSSCASAPAEVVQRSLRTSVIEGCLHAVMVGASESYLGALAVQLGHQDLALALLVSVPLLIGAAAQIGASALVRILGSRKRVVVIMAAVQALVNVGLVVIALCDVRSFWPLFLVKTLYWVSGMALGPAWSAWMGSLTQGVDRGDYFARRSAIVQVSLLVSYAMAGFVLEHGRLAASLLPAFALLHAVATLARIGSVLAFWKQQDPLPDDEDHRRDTRLRLLLALKHGRWRIAVFLAVFYFGAYIALPFFTPHMLNVLRLDYLDFMWLTATATLLKALTFSLWAKLARLVGMRAVLFVSTLGTALVAVLWTRAFSMEALLAVQALSGVAWAGFEFASFQLLMKSAPDAHRLSFFALSTFFTGVLQVLGALVGSLLLWCFPWGYELAFVVSAFGRGLPCLLLLSPMVALLAKGPLPRVFFRVISMRPEGGAVRTPIVAGKPAAGG